MSNDRRTKGDELITKRVRTRRTKQEQRSVAQAQLQRAGLNRRDARATVYGDTMRNATLRYRADLAAKSTTSDDA